MKQALVVLIVAILAVVLWSPVSTKVIPAMAAATPFPNPACGTPLYTPVPNGPVNAAPMAAQLQHSETCTTLALPVFNVQTFGAKSDGTTNDSVAEQKAEDTCNNLGGGSVYFPKGTTIAGGITFYTECQNVGAGVGATIVQLPAAANTAVFISQNFASLTGTNSVAGVFDTGFKEMSIDGNKANESAGAACVQYYGYNEINLHTRYQNCFGDGLYSEWGCCSVPNGSAATMMNDVRSLNNGGNGITWKGPHDGIWQDVVTNLNGNDGVFVSGQGEGLLLSQFHSWGNTQQYALYLDSGIASTICQTCILEGALVSQYFVDGPFNTFTGQMYNAQGTASDMVIGGAHGAGTNIISANVTASTGQTGAIIVWGNDSGQNQISIAAFCQPATTPATSGSQGSNDILAWSLQNCTGTAPSLGVNTIQANSLQSHFGTNLLLKSNASSANSGSLQMNLSSGTNNNQGLEIFDGGSANAIHFRPDAFNGIATYQASVVAPTGACIFGSIDIRVDTGAAPGTQLYTCLNVSGTGTWEPVTQPSGATPDTGTYNFGGAVTFGGTPAFNAGLVSTGQVNVEATPSAACQTNSPIAAVCIGSPTTSTIGLDLGKVNGGYGGTTASNSASIGLTSNNGTSDLTAQILFTSGHTISISGGTISSNSNTITSGTGNLIGGQYYNGADCTLAASGTMAAGSHACKLTFTGISSMIVTYPAAYATRAYCTVNDETTLAGAKAVCNAGSATVTASNGDVVDFMLTGN